MHPCLSIEEIRRDIFGHLTKDADLMAIAIASKSFTDAALDKLWAGQEILGRLIPTFPEDSLTGTREGCDRVFKRSLIESDWTRPLYYGGKMRTLTWNSPRDWELGNYVTHKMLVDICSYRPRKTLLPHLQIFKLMDWEATEIPLITSFLSSTIIEVQLKAWPVLVERPSLLPILSSLPNMCPQLETAVLYNRGEPDTFPISPSQVATFLRETKAIRTIKLVNIPLSEVFVEMCRLSQVEKIKTSISPYCLECIQMEGDEFDLFLNYHHLPVQSSLSGLRRLRFLTIGVHDWGCGLALLTLLHGGLEQLVLYAAFTSSTATVESLIEIIARKHSRLVHLGLYGDSQQSIDEPSSPPTNIGALFELSSMASLSLDFSWVNCLGDPWIEEAALAWPKLAHIYLQGASDQGPRITSTGILALVRICKGLEDLDVDAVWRSIDDGSADGIVNKNIKILKLEASRLELDSSEYDSMARRILAVFPALQDIEVSRFASDWIKLRSVIKSYLQSRSSI